MSFVNELKRRNVLRVGAAYLVSSWLLIQVTETILPLFGFGDTPARLVVIIMAIGFIPSLIFSWVFEITPEGLKKDADVDREQSITHKTGKQLDRIILLMLALALAYFAFDKFVLDPVEDVQIAKSARQEGRSEAFTESFGDKSIAVLPFVDMSNKKDQEYMSDGIAEELLNLLAKIPELRVISRSSAFSFKDKDLDIRMIATQLNVTYILEGSVRKAGNQVRITAQLIEARSDTHLWSETYDRELKNIFAIQDEISAAVVARLKITLAGKIPTTSRADPEAYRLFLLAKYYARPNEGDIERYRKAEALLKQALVIDPGFDRAWRQLAVFYGHMHDKFGVFTDAEAYTLQLNALEKALEINPENASTHTSLGSLEHNLSKAAQHFSNALELDPYNDVVLNNSAVFLFFLGRYDEAIAVYRFQLTLNPLNEMALSNLSNASLSAGYADQVISAGETILEIHPESAWVRFNMGSAYLLKGQAEKALEVFRQEPIEQHRLLGEVMAYQAMEQLDASNSAYEELVQKYGQENIFLVACAMAYRNESDLVFAVLETEVHNHNKKRLTGLIASPLFQRIHEDPRWTLLLDKNNMLPANLDAIDFEISLPE